MFYTYWQADRGNNIVIRNDTVDISRAGRNALENKMSALRRAGQNKAAGKLSPVSSFSVISDFERAVSAKKEEGIKSNTFDCCVNQMISAYKRMRNGIEEKYADTAQSVSVDNTKNSGIKEQAYQAFMYSVNNENIRLLPQSKEGLSNIKLDLGILKPARNELNYIWDYYKAATKGLY